jgi:hypothetical protein
MMIKEKIINFRIDDQLYAVIKGFAKEKGITNISELIREIIIMHFSGLMLGYFQGKGVEEMTDEFLKKYKALPLEDKDDGKNENDGTE